MDSKPWLIIEVVHPELRPTRFARRTDLPGIDKPDIDKMLCTAGIMTAAHDELPPHPACYSLLVFSWRATTYDAARPEDGVRRTRARPSTYAESRDRMMAMRKATSWRRLPREMRAAQMG